MVLTPTAGVQLKQSPNDPKSYRAITLKNGLRVLLVHNDKTAKAAAALAVNVGHFHDPEHRQGLAHFLEHMLFLGTKKYPDGSEYQKFISQHGGTHNAWTAAEHTCFFFDIQQTQFEQALDRFSQFFIAPLLSQEFVEKERENIDAEFKLKLKDDIRRLYDVHKETINPDHPFSKFSVGTSETLQDIDGVSITPEVRALFEDYYCAQGMTLVLESSDSLDSLASYANEYFSTIAQARKGKVVITSPLYLPEHQQQCIYVKPVKDDHQLIISFAMPAIDKYYREKPESLLAYLLGYEGKGSILSALKDRQWAIGLTAGSGVNGSNFKDFNISIALTPLGEQHKDQVIELVLSFVQLMKDTPLATHYYQDKQAMAKLAFDFQEKMSPLDTVSQLVINMQHYPAEDYIFGDYAMTGLVENSYQQLLALLSVNNMRIVLISQHNQFDQTSKWYQVPYRIENFSQQQLQQWQNPSYSKCLSLPTANPYIVNEPKVLDNEDSDKVTQPQLIKDGDGLKVWFKQDQTFKVPKGYVYVGLDSPVTIESTVNIAMTRLFVDVYSDAIVEQHYDAELAGIHYHVYSHQGGLSLQLSGLSEKQGSLLATLLASIKQVSINENKFHLLKQQLLNHWSNADKSKSISQLFAVLSSALQPSNPSAQNMHDALSTVTFEQFQSFTETVFKQVSLNMLIHGNWHKHDAIQMADTVTAALKDGVSDKYVVKVPLVDIAQQGEFTLPLHLKEHDHACVIYYPMAQKGEQTIAKTIVTSHLFSPHFFQLMRTERQYGYLVGVGYVPIHNYPGLAFYIQSPHTDALELKQAINEFIDSSEQLLEQISEQEWHHLQHGLASQLQEKDTSLRIRSQRFWAAICNEDLHFNHKQKVINALLNLSFDDIKQYIQQTLCNTADPDRINLMSYQEHKINVSNNDKEKVIEDIEEIRNFFARKS